MKFKTGDEARVKRTNKETMYKHIEGTTVLILNNVCGDLYRVFDCIGGQWVLDEEMLEPVDSKTLRMADGTVIGEFNTGGTISIHDLPSSEWYQPMRLEFKNGSSITAIPNEDAIRSKEPELVWIDKIALPTATETKEMVERVRQEIFKFTNAFPKEEKKMPTKFTFYTVDTSRINKTNNTKVDTIMTCVHIGDKVGYATCDKEDYDEREGILNAIANLCCDGSFDKAYRKAVKEKKISETLDRTCSYCRKVFDTVEERQEHEAWHIERRKARHQRYLLRKRAKEIAFEEAAQKIAKEMQNGDKK